MTNNHRYFLSEGCCICGTKHSTSQFRPWYEHYGEETLCRVFSLDSLDGRRGYLCNPCVLFIKRTIQSMDSFTLNSDPKKRLDLKLKGYRRAKITEIFPPGSTQSSKPVGYFARSRRIVPKYVFTGQRYVSSSAFQFVPAGERQHPRMDLEDESDTQIDMPLCRIRDRNESAGIGLMKSRNDNSAQADGKTHTKNGNHPYGQSGLKTYGTRANVLKGKVIMRKTNKKFLYEGCNSDDEETDTSDEMVDGEEDLPEGPYGGLYSSKEKVHHPIISNKRKLGEVAKSRTEAFSSFSCGKKMKISEPASDAKVERKNRRVHKTPVRNFKRPKVSFIDSSYWQTYPLCCTTMYIGEGGNCALQHSEGGKQCPVALKKLRQLVKSLTTARRTSSSAKLRRASDITPKDVEADEESEVDFVLATEQLRCPKDSASSTSSQDGRQDSGASTPKETRTDQESEVGSVVSSGEDDLNDSRMNFSNSPLMEKSCGFFP